MFSNSYEDLISNIDAGAKTSAFEYIENKGILSFIENFIFIGIINSLTILAKLSFPYLFILNETHYQLQIKFTRIVYFF